MFTHSCSSSLLSAPSCFLLCQLPGAVASALQEPRAWVAQPGGSSGVRWRGPGVTAFPARGDLAARDSTSSLLQLPGAAEATLCLGPALRCSGWAAAASGPTTGKGGDGGPGLMMGEAWENVLRKPGAWPRLCLWRRGGPVVWELFQAHIQRESLVSRLPQGPQQPSLVL